MIDIKEAKQIQQNGKMVQHKESKNICGLISSFDDEETGVYLKPHYIFIPLEKLQVFNVYDYANSITYNK